MFVVVLRIIRDRFFSLLAYCLAGAIFLWMYVGFFPFVQDKAEELNKLIEVYPQSFLEAFGIQTGQLWFDKIESFLAMEYFSFIWPIMAIALLVAIGGYSIAGEVERTTIEFLLAQPISRSKLFLAKYLAGVFNLVVFAVISIFAVIPLAVVYKVDYQLSHYITIFILGLLFGLAVFSLATLFSSIFSEKGKAYFITCGILIVMYVLNIVSSMKESLKDLKYFSFFYYFNGQKALVENQIDNLAYWVFLGVFLFCSILVLIWFKKRDLSVS